MDVRDQAVRVEVHLAETVLHGWEAIPPFGHYPTMGQWHSSAEVDCPFDTWTIVRWPKRQGAPQGEDLFTRGGPGDDLKVTGLLVRVRKVAK
jgi:hypothetical protein